jgi:hypothetical protein
VNHDQIEYMKAFNRLSKEEKSKLLESMTDEEREKMNKLHDEYEK